MKNFYLSKSQLVDAVVQYRAGDCTALACAAYQIGHGLCGYLTQRGYTFDEDEIVQEAVVVILERADNIKLEGNVFSYLTTVILNHCRQLARNSNTYRTALSRYARDVHGAYGTPDQERDGH